MSWGTLTDKLSLLLPRWTWLVVRKGDLKLIGVEWQLTDSVQALAASLVVRTATVVITTSLVVPTSNAISLVVTTAMATATCTVTVLASIHAHDNTIIGIATAWSTTTASVIRPVTAATMLHLSSFWVCPATTALPSTRHLPRTKRSTHACTRTEATHTCALAVSALWKGKEIETDQRGSAWDGRREERRHKVITDPFVLIWCLEKEGSGRHDLGNIDQKSRS